MLPIQLQKERQKGLYIERIKREMAFHKEERSTRKTVSQTVQHVISVFPFG